MVHPTVARTAEQYVAHLDRLLPGALAGFYLVGSVALGAYRDGRSDVDFVAVLDSEVGSAELRRLRLLHIRSGLHTATAALRRGHSPLSGTCNGVFVRSADLAAPVTEITPVASHTGYKFTTGPVGSDVSPVAWKVLAERGVPIRGPEPSSLPLHPQPELLRSWNLDNLERYWRPWALALKRPPRAWNGLRPHWSTAYGVLGPPRLHRTLATGDVISKVEAGEYALDVFPRGWHPLIGDALAYWRREPRRLRLSPWKRRQHTAEFVLDVIAAAQDLQSAPST